MKYDMKLFNSLSRKVEEFIPLSDNKVGMYTCGPTVYQPTSIGNFRTYTMSDILHRVLLLNGYDVNYIMNITDVGHLTGDNLGDSSQGEDRLEAASKKEGRNAQEIADYYSESFKSDYKKLNLIPPTKWVRATNHIADQISLIKILEDKGYTYRITDGIYFDTGKCHRYGELSTLDKIKEGARVDINPEKKNPRDFALWKFSVPEEKRQQEWASPWGTGFPGWHIECSAMSMKYLGPTFDIHVGGEDLRGTHHPNEIAQSEAATGRKFVNYWVHISFLLIDGGKMSKSLGNAYSLDDLEERGYNASALKYLFLSAHYRSNLNFTFDSLGAADTNIKRIKQFIIQNSGSPTFEDIKDYSNTHIRKFTDALNDDLDTPKALVELNAVVKGTLPIQEKLTTLHIFDDTLGLGLFDDTKKDLKIDPEIEMLIRDREKARKLKNWKAADLIRKRIEDKGYVLRDTSTGSDPEERK